jgi:UPF0755 protein
MSRDEYERWASEPDDQESGRNGRRGGRRSRRSAAPEDSWPGGSPSGQGSGEWSGPDPRSGGSSPWQPGGYDPAAYTDPGGYADPRGYPDPGGYTDPGGYGNSGGYPAPGGGYPDPGSYPGSGDYYESGGHSSRALPAGSGGYYENGYPENSYPESRSYSSGDHSPYPDNGYQGGDGRSYGNGDYRDSGYGDQAYSDRGYREAGYPGDEYPGGGHDPYGGADPYGGREPYGGDDQYGGHDRYGASAGYRTGDAYPAPDGYSESGTGRGGYDAPAGYEHGGGYDDVYDPAAGVAPQASAGGRGAEDDDAYGWQRSVDDSGISRRRGRGDDEIDADSARHNGFFRGFGGGDDNYGHRPPKRRRSRAPMVALFVVIVFLVAIAGGGVYAYKWYSKRHADWVNSPGYGSVIVQVKPGEFACTQALENTMVSAGVVASGTAFCDAAKSAANSASLEPGSFRLHKHMGAALAWKMLVSPKSRVQQTVAVPDGLPASKIIVLLAKGTGIPLSQFQSALKNDVGQLGLPSWAKGNPEGFLYPATYPIQPGTSAVDILKMMVSKFNSEAASLKMAAVAKRVGFTELQVITEASLLEAEVGSVPKYFPDVARVIDNRLNQVPPMKLQLDSTVAYATGHYIYNLSQSDLNVKSPYNTFKHAGLPPGPIDSPDAAAIQAVLHPNDSQTARTWLYFVTVNKAGKTDFTASYSLFLTWSAEAKKALG